MPTSSLFPFSGYLFSAPLSGQFFCYYHLNLPGVGEGRCRSPVMPGDWAVFQGQRDHHGWPLFPFVPVFSPLVPGFLGG